MLIKKYKIDISDKISSFISTMQHKIKKNDKQLTKLKTALWQ